MSEEQQAPPCAHQTFDADTRVVRLTRSDDDPTVIGYRADIRIVCTDCKEPFAFLGLPIGMATARPTVSADGQELRAVIAPASLVLLKQPAEQAPPPPRIHLPGRKLDT